MQLFRLGRQLVALCSLLAAHAVLGCHENHTRETPPPRHPAPAALHDADSRDAAPRYASPPPGTPDDVAPALEEPAPEAEHDATRDEHASPSEAPSYGEPARPTAPPSAELGGVSGGGTTARGSDARAAAPGAASGSAQLDREEAEAYGSRRAMPERRATAKKRSADRPGLATHWGETRYSPTQEVAFYRDSPSRPTAVAELRYDDRRGALRQLPEGHYGWSERSLLGGAVSVRLVDESGRPFPALLADDRLVSLGASGERYALTIENHTAERYEVVATVDGLDVLDGETGSFTKRGYLVDAHSSVTIDGFRRSGDNVAAFRFGDVRGSYAASKGKARNVGVIGVALFAERRPAVRRAPRRYDDETYLRETADPFPGRYARPPAY